MHVLVTCKNEDDQFQNEGASVRVFTRFLPLQGNGDFSSRSRAANSAVRGPIWPNFELVRDAIDVFITCQYEEDPIKNRGARVFTTLYINFADAQGQITLVLVVISGRNLNSSKLSCISSLPARMRLIKSKMKELECSQDFSHSKSMWIFSRRSRAANSAVLGPILPNFELVRDAIDVLITCQYEEVPIKMKALECSQHFPHSNPMGCIRCHGHHSVPIRPGSKPNTAFPLPQ